MADIDLKTETPDATLPSTGFLFGADSQAAASPSVYTLASVISSILGNAASADALVFNNDARITRRGAANLRLGAADAAAPVAQTLSVQSVVAGTSNTAGANLTITGSQGTGTGAGGSIIFQVAPAGSSGTAQNALATALSIISNGNPSASPFVYFGSSTTQTPALFAGSSGWLCVGRSDISGDRVAFNAGNGILVSSGSTIGFSSNNISAQGSGDTILARDAANTLALRNSTNAQELRVYKTTTGTVYKALLGDNNLIKIAGEAFTDGSGANIGTLTNSPVTGNPTKWIPIDDNGTTRYIPAW